jgi:methionyl-tRNA formyltransferase
MKIVLLTCNAPNQAALAAKLSKQFQLAGIVIEEKKVIKKRRKIKDYVNALIDRLLFQELRKSWFGMQDYYRKQFTFPAIETLIVTTINSNETIDFLKKLQPDLVMVSGTAMLKKKILELEFKIGIVNLHTGLSPFIKGGPNCTNWCLSINQFHLIGNTVMWIDAGIDSGDLIATQFTPLNGEESLKELQIKVMEHAHQLYLHCVTLLQESPEKIKAVKQNSIASGQTFYTRDWTISAKWKAIRNFRRWKSTLVSENYKSLQRQVQLVIP